MHFSHFNKCTAGSKFTQQCLHKHESGSQLAGCLPPHSMEKHCFYERPQYSPSEQPVTNQTDQLPQLEACSVEVGTKPRDWQSTPSLLGRRGERKQAIHHFVPKFTHPPVQRKKANPRQVIIIFFPLRLVPSL